MTTPSGLTDLIALIQSRGGSITARQLMRASRKYRSSALIAHTVLDQLAGRGLGTFKNKTFTLHKDIDIAAPWPASLPMSGLGPESLPKPTTVTTPSVPPGAPPGSPPVTKTKKTQVKKRQRVATGVWGEEVVTKTVTDVPKAGAVSGCDTAEAGISGDDSAPIAGGDGKGEETPAREAETPGQAEKRWRREGRDIVAHAFRGRVRDECRTKGMSRRDAHDHAWVATIAAFPPEGQPATEVPMPDEPAKAEAADGNGNGQGQGIGDLPAGWPTLPSNASLPVEIGWVQSNRLVVVEEQPGGATRVHLDRAHEPAPSRGALGWLDISIRNHAKYVDVVARVLQTVQDEQEHTRRERTTMDDMEALLLEMNAT